MSAHRNCCVCVYVCVCVCEREREREKVSEFLSRWEHGRATSTLHLEKIEVSGKFLWAEGTEGAVIHARYVFSMGAMLILKEMCTSGRKSPRKAGRSTVDAKRLGRPSSDEKLEESRGVFAEFGGGTIAGTASELNGSRASG